MNKLNVAIFGGSFYPPHIGHMWVAQQIYELDFIDKVILMPNYSARPWGKETGPPELRLKLCRLCTKEYPNIEVSDIEIKNKFTFTYQTVEYFKKNHPDYEVYWVVGSDWDVKTFKNYEFLKENCKFIKVFRPSYKVLKQEKEEGIITVFLKFSFNISSTAIRERIKKGLPVTGLIPDSIKEIAIKFLI